MAIEVTTDLNLVDTGQIVDGAVTSAKIAVGGVNSSSLADNAVVASKISSGSVGTAKIDSTGASSNWVLTANGSGGTSFSSPTIAPILFNTVTSEYTLVLSDKDKIVQSNSTAAFNIIVPPNSSVAFSNGDQVHVLQIGSGQQTISAGAGVTVNATPGLKIRAQWSAVTLIKRDTNTWVATGDLAP